MNMPTIQVLPTPADVAHEAADVIVAACRHALEVSETFSLCLAGGTSWQAAYKRLASDALRDRIDWRRVEVFFGDERTVPPDHKDSNFGAAKAALLDHVPIPGDNIYRIKGELPPEQAAQEYEDVLARRFGETGGVDLLLLGMGDDSHTLSLFPGTAALDELRRRCVANFVPKFDRWRITMTSPFVNRSASVLGVVTDRSKAAALANVLEGDLDPHKYPLQLVDPQSGRFHLIVDAAAVEMAED